MMDQLWFGISSEARTDLILIKNGTLKTLTDILKKYVRRVNSICTFHWRSIVLMHYNARPHIAQVVNEFLNKREVQRLQRPACSPDLYPIEHFWDKLKRSVRRRPVRPTTLQELRLA